MTVCIPNITMSRLHELYSCLAEYVIQKLEKETTAGLISVSPTPLHKNLQVLLTGFHMFCVTTCIFGRTYRCNNHNDVIN